MLVCTNVYIAEYLKFRHIRYIITDTRYTMTTSMCVMITQRLNPCRKVVALKKAI